MVIEKFKTLGIERLRVLILLIFLLLWGLAVGAALVKTQVFDYTKNIAQVRKQSNRIFSLHPKRGTIFDSKGDVLAISIKAQSAFLSNKNSAESLKILDIIKQELKSHKNIAKNWLDMKDIRRRVKEGKRFIWLKRKLTDEELDIFKEVQKTCDSSWNSELDFLEEYKRIYPQDFMAAHVLGGVGIDQQGLAGIEFGLDGIIKGKGSKVEVLLDARRKQYSQEYLELPVPGKDVYLTIDSSVQFFVERELRNTVQKYKAKSGAVIVMNVADGAILAMAGYPGYQPGNISDTPGWIQKNEAIAYLYHPGSTFKIILAATALETNLFYPQQVFNCCNGEFHIKNETIYDEKPADYLTFEDIIIHSSNIGAARIGIKLGKNRYYNGMKKFGFGERMGFTLPGEEKGILRDVKDWSGVSVAFLAYGYEILVTPLQMVRAFNVIASGGFMVQPHILQQLAGDDPVKVEKKRILSPGTVERMRSIMTRVVETGTGQKARIDGIEIAGKTGTTKKMKKRDRQESLYVASFGGFFPAGNPKVTIFVVIDEPTTAFYGGDVAAPLFKSIAEKLVVYLNIFPELDNTNEIRI